MKKLRLYNTIIGWIIFGVSAIVYLSTIEPSTSLWDCGEFISSAFKLEVGHPPGAPIFMIIARFFSLFAGGDVTKVALMVNAFSGLASAFTILFLFWSITHLAIKLVKPDDEVKSWQFIAILGSSAVGALAYAFSDTFWFSAVEGEVYASSSLFTAVVFWAILKWENTADEKYANRWLILIAYLMGLSIGVHLLNLLVIPAIVLVYYFKKYQVTRNGVIAALIISAILLGIMMYIIIPGVVVIASWFELMFVNSFGLPYNSGLLFYLALLAGVLVWGIIQTHRKRQVLANTIVVIITVIILGYSSFAMLVIRSMADPPMDENDPETVFSLMYYLNREQYGDRPLFYGQYFNAEITGTTEGKPTYTRKNNKYIITNRKLQYKYNPKYTGFFPRMHSADPSHIEAYKEWAHIKESDVFYPLKDANGRIMTDNAGKTKYDYRNPKKKPSLGQNIRFLVYYQLGHMYFRYFMWNFSGRQNQMQGYGGPLEGNWITGIGFLDTFFVGEPPNKPKEIKDCADRNQYYLLPLLLGLIGILYHSSHHKKDFWVVMTLFVLTGIAIVIYLNQTPNQPRERDYAYAASFYAFAIWIGLGVLGIINFFGSKVKKTPAAFLSVLICLCLVPGIMAKENWRDHDRSGRYTARDIASDYLNSCEPNAILFTNGDNDTFPLWYAQEVEGIRTDVRVVNLMLLNMDWYIEQMKMKAYESDPLPISLPSEKYINGTRDVVYIQDRLKESSDIKEILAFIASDNPATKVQSQSGRFFEYIPTRQFFVPVDSSKVLSTKTVAFRDKNLIVDKMDGVLNGTYLNKSDLIVLDIIANNNWKRPIYYVSTGHSGTLGLENYMQLEGFAYRLVPIKTTSNSSFETGRIDTDILYDRLMKTYRYGRMEEPDVFLDNFHVRTMSIVRLRYRFTKLANALIEKNDLKRAEEVLDRVVELTPHRNLPYDMFMPGIAESYYRINKFDKGSAILNDLIDLSDRYLTYYFSFKKKYFSSLEDEITLYMRILGNTMQISKNYNQQDVALRATELFDKFNQEYMRLKQ